MRLIFFVFLLLTAASVALSGPLQEAIDKADAGAVITLGEGLYQEKITIDKPLTLKGDGRAVIKGDGTGSVITVKASHVEIAGLTVTGSGVSHESIDSCIALFDVNNIKIRDNTLRDCLFGINFEKVNRSVIERNNITSKPHALGLRGDAVRLWYSHSNTIRGNFISAARDNVFWYSSANRFEDNRIENSRYAVHFMYSDRNTVSKNQALKNSVGMFFMFSHSSRISENLLQEASDAFGIGIGLKECSDFLVTRNTILYNARGFYIDQSPYQPDTINMYRENSLLYNTTGIQFHGTTLKSVFEENIFAGNTQDIANDTRESKLPLNSWRLNSWDKYEGFDFDKDGVGDTPMEVKEYADKITHYEPNIKFFYGAPAMLILDFLARLAPFSEPEMLAVDESPVMVRNQR